MLRIFGFNAVFFLALAAAAAAGASENVSVFGNNPDLAAGAQALQLGHYADGIERTLAGLQSESSLLARSKAFNNLCAGYAAIRQYEDAVRYCNLALEINARNWRIYNNRAIALLGIGRIGDASHDLETGLELNPESPTLGKVARLIAEQRGQIRTAQLF